MTARFFRFLACQLLLAFACASAHAADAVDITLARIEATDDGYKLRANYAFELNPSLELAIQKGVPFSFTTEIDMTRPRLWGWWRDEHTVSSRRTVTIQYDALTRGYHVTMKGSLRQDADTLDEALSWVRRPPSWLIAPKTGLKPGETYNVTLRMYVDRDMMIKPLQIDALNNADLRLASPKKTFTYTAE